MTGRPWKIHPDELRPQLEAMRGEGWTCKMIARALDYSAERIQDLCLAWNIKKRLQPKRGIDRAQVKLDAAGDGIRAPAVNANTSAASEAKPSDTQLPGSHSSDA